MGIFQHLHIWPGRPLAACRAAVTVLHQSRNKEGQDQILKKAGRISWKFVKEKKLPNGKLKRS